jgi:hypothetical protein
MSSRFGPETVYLVEISGDWQGIEKGYALSLGPFSKPLVWLGLHPQPSRASHVPAHAASAKISKLYKTEKTIAKKPVNRSFLRYPSSTKWKERLRKSSVAASSKTSTSQIWKERLPASPPSQLPQNS